MTDELEAIRARHEADERASEEGDGVSPLRLIAATIDRGDLIGLLDAARAELAEINVWTDDDQRGLTAAVADAMWYWDDMPMDCDDAISLTSILKNSLRDNGFQIVRRSAEALKGT